MQDSLNSTEISRYLTPEFPGSIIIKQKTASTNTDAKELALQNACPYTTVIADTQTAGRGRGEERTFYSPQDTGIYLSILLPYTAENLLKITPAIGVAVCQTIESFTDVKPEIKWVNDILMQGRKVCGILCESIPNTSMAVAGIGINFSTAEFPTALDGIAGPVFVDPPVTRNEFIGTLLNRILGLKYDQCISEYRKRSCVIGKSIRYLEKNIWHTAVATDIDENGCLGIIEDNVRKTLVSGEITLRITE
ncbi:MAG TPA: biotin--[acetyl-CoA-carboxylase] ligase [Methanocorpusculum sp.]|nr:biotin--[acetyl-CoA-carboxylase] ligase [Methanocorpusculum sp.]